MKTNHTTIDISGVNARMVIGCGGCFIVTGANARATNRRVTGKGVANKAMVLATHMDYAGGFFPVGY